MPTRVDVINAVVTDARKSSLCVNKTYLFVERQDQKMSFMSAWEFNLDYLIIVSRSYMFDLT